MEGDGSLGQFPIEIAAKAYPLSQMEANHPFSIPELPYSHFIRRFNMSSVTSTNHPLQVMSYLQTVYLSLLDAMIDSLRSQPDLSNTSNTPKGLTKGFSYNLLMTKSHMHVIPRSQGIFEIPHESRPGNEEEEEGGEGLHKGTTEPAIISINALAYTVRLPPCSYKRFDHR